MLYNTAAGGMSVPLGIPPIEALYREAEEEAQLDRVALGIILEPNPLRLRYVMQ